MSAEGLEMERLSVTSEIDGTLAPCSKLSKVDGALRFSENNIKQILLDSVNESETPDEHILNADFHPTSYILAHLAWRVYRERDGRGEPLQLPRGWHLLTTASSPNGYFGAAYWNPETQQIVIAHRGTNGLMDVRAGFTNVWSVALNKYTDRLNSAMTFADKMRRLLNDVNRTPGASFQLSLTGHSLGGWLAQITCFSCKYLVKKSGLFIRSNASESIHAHAVVFDSPGCKKKLEEIQKEYDVRYQSFLSLDKLDITNYFSAPNRINTCNLHVGTVYRIFIDLSDMNFIDKNTFMYNLATHRMNKIVQVFDSITGDVVKDADGKRKIQEIIDWPLTEYPERMWEEFRDFFKWANWLNDYHPVGRSEIYEGEGNIRIRYQTKEYKENYCCLRVFTDDERRLLQCWHTLIHSNKELIMLQNFTNRHNMGDCRELLPDFQIDVDKIVISSGESVKKLINRTKQLMRYFQTELTDTIKMQLGTPTLAESMCKASSKTYLDSLEKYDVDFKDVVNLKIFLENEMSPRVLHVFSEDVTFEAARIHNICQQMEKCVNLHSDSDLKLEKYVLDQHRLFLSWEQILALQNFVDIMRILKWESCTINLLVIVYPVLSNNSKNNEKLLENILSCVEGLNTFKKIVFITSKQQDTEATFLSGTPNILKKVTPVCFEHLTRESQNLILSKEILEMQNEQISLKKLLKTDEIGEERINEVLDSNILKNLLVKDSLLVEKKHKRTYSSDRVFYAQVCQITSGERMLQFLFNENCVYRSSKNTLFMVTGINGNITNPQDELIRRLGSHERYERASIIRVIKDRVFINTDTLNHLFHFQQYCSRNSDKRIYWLEVGEGAVIWKQIFDTKFYIERQLYSQMTLSCDLFKKDFNSLKKDFISEFVSDIFIFGNVSKECLINLFTLPKELEKRFNEWENMLAFSDKEEAASHFEQISKTHTPSHLIFMESNKFIWQRSCGSLKNLRSYVVPDDPQNEQFFIDDKERKLIILSGEAGMGKSATLQSLSRRLKSSWVINVDLKNYNSLETFPADIDFDTIVHFLAIGNTYLATDLMTALFKESLRHDYLPVLILFDGFDEVKEEQLQHQVEDQNSITQKEIVKIIKFLISKTTARVLIACRKFQSGKLENDFSVFASSFEELNENQQKQFLEEIWSSRLVVELGCGEIQEDKQTQLKRYTKESFDKAKRNLGNDICTFMGIPLQLQMIAEVAQPQIRLFSVTQIQYFEPVLPDFNIFELYKRFINIKYNIYFHENSNLSSGLSVANKTWVTETLDKKHRSLAFGIFFPDHAKNFLGDKHMSLIQDMKDNEKTELLRVGLIRLKFDGNIDFIHRTFAEFFVADILGHWLSKTHGRHTKYPATEDFLVSKIMLEPQNKIVRLFLNNLLRQTELSTDSFKFYAQKVSNLWITNQELFFTKDNQTVLHTLTHEHCEKIIDLFLGLIKTSYVAKDTSIVNLIDLLAVRDRNGDTAIYIAAKLRYKHLMDTFLNAIKYQTSSAKEKILLGTIFRQSEDRNDKHLKYLLECLKSKEYASILYQSKLIIEKWQFISSFLDAAKTGDVNKVHEYCIKLCKIKGQNILRYLSVTDKCGKTALHLAAGLGRYNVVEYLVNHNADINVCDGSGKTPLILAAMNDFAVIVQYLVEQGANISISDRYKTSAISWAAKCGNLEIVEYLADCGANIHDSDVSGKTALAYAAKSCNLEVVRYLAELGTNINSVDKQGRSVLQIAIKARSWGIAKYLIEKGADLDIYDWHGMNALQLAIKIGKWTFVDFLMEKGATIESSHWKGTTLHLLIKTRKWNIIQALHNRGADVKQMPSHEKNIFVAHMIPDGIVKDVKRERNLDKACYSILRLGKREFLQLLIKKTGDDVLGNVFKMVEKTQKAGEIISEEMLNAVNNLEKRNVFKTVTV